jgi:peroxiredoxin Q/BCP
MLAIGDVAPDFSFGSGTLYGALKSGPAVVYFYPADFTPVCTKQACMVRDLHAELAAAGITVIGVSPQGEASHARFKAEHALSFHLVADEGLAIAKAYGARGIFGLPIPWGARRVTYLIGVDGKILDRAAGELGVAAHERLLRAAAKRV